MISTARGWKNPQVILSAINQNVNQGRAKIKTYLGEKNRKEAFKRR